MKRLLAVLVAAVLALGLIGAGPAEAAKKKKFRNAYVCGLSVLNDDTGDAEQLFVATGAGRYTEDGTRISPCAYEGAPTWHPSVGKVRITARLYAGSKVVRKKSVVVDNRTGATHVDFPGYDFKHTGDSQAFTLNGKRVKITVTFKKKGYRTKVVTARTFCYCA